VHRTARRANPRRTRSIVADGRGFDLENGRTIVVQQKVDAVAADQSGVLE